MSNSKLSKACFEQNHRLILDLLDEGQDPNGEPFVQSVLKGDILSMKLLLSYWAKINPCDIHLSEMRHGSDSEQTTFLKSANWLASLSGM